MDLLFLIKSLDNATGGAERVLADVTNGLAERGHRISILTYDPIGARSFYPLHPSIEWIPLGIGQPDRPSTFSETVRRMVAMRRIIVQRNPDVAVGFMHSMFIPLGIALVGTNQPVVASEHIVQSHYWRFPLQFLLLQLTPYLTEGMTVISERVRSGFTFNIRRHMTVIPNPVGLRIASMADSSGNGLPQKTILTVGRLTNQKDHTTLVQAFSALAGEFPEWNLRIIGDGELLGRLEKKIAALELQDRVQLPGTTPEIGEDYVRAQIFVLPSRYESFGLAAAEALAHGLPVLAFADCEGVNALVADDVNGVLVRGRDRVAAMTSELRRLMSSPELRHRLGSAGPASVVEFSKAKICDQWENFLHDRLR